MSAPHKAYPIANFTEGLALNREPFLSPRDAWRVLENGRVFRGRLEKRNGYALFGTISSDPGDVTQNAESAGTTSLFTGFPYSQGLMGPAVPETMDFQFQDASLSVITARFKQPLQYTVPENYQVVAADFNSPPDLVIGSYNIASGTILVDWTLHNNYTGDLGAPGLVAYQAAATDPVMALPNFKELGNEYLLAITTTNAYLWNGEFFDLEESNVSPSNTFTGTAQNQFWTWPLENYLVITNGVDPVYKWTPGVATPLEPMPVDILPSAPGTESINTAKFVVKFKGRLVYIAPTEKGLFQPLRARWTVAGSNETFDDDGLGFADAPPEYIEAITVGFVGARLFVGFENKWMELASTGSDLAPLAWIPITSRFGSIALNTTIEDSDRLLTRSKTGMQAVDPNGQYPIDFEIPDTVASFDPSRGDISHAIRNDEKRAHWWSYVQQSQDENDLIPRSVLVAQYDEKNELSWSKYDWAFTSFGQFEQESGTAGVTWDSLPETWDYYSDTRWDDSTTSAKFPTVLGGTEDGRVMFFANSNTDIGAPISFSAKTQVIQPLGDQKSHFGWLDIYAEATTGAIVTFTFFDQVGGSAYKTMQVNLSPDESTGKVYRRVAVNRTALMHQIGISVTNSNFLAIDALIPWFRPAGRVVTFG